ncbi:MAG: hypothetical protein CMM96_00505 [Rickettsiales bacterium]|nr:hypothetical protein [Rickettsiales bacterium]|tara:strand:- start:4387 stop:4839 length:453 start_codon:yes stop_codon:yes gene_type:complete
MSTAYRTKRKKVITALVDKLKGINGQHPYNSNVFNNVSGTLKFLDEIEEYPKLCVIAGDEIREYQTGGFKWRFLTVTIRAYVRDEDDAQEELATLFEDIEKIIDENDALVYDTSIVPEGKTTSMTIDSLTTDEGVIAPLGIGEMIVTVRY